VDSGSTQPPVAEAEWPWWAPGAPRPSSAPDPGVDDGDPVGARAADLLATDRAYRARQRDVAPLELECAGGGPPRRGNDGGWLRRFVHRHGWRAYALPILAVVTVVALATQHGDHDKAAAAQQVHSAGAGATTPTVKAPPTATGDQSLKTDAPSAGSQNSVLQSDALPPGGAYTVTGTGTFAVISGSGPVVGKGTVHRYSIEIENGITGIDPTAFAATVQAVLSDPRSWTAGTGAAAIALQRVDSGPIDFHVTLTTSMTVRTLCGYDIPIETSCFAPKGQLASKVNRVVINDARWVRGDAAYIADLAAYQEYMINHESGHALGHEHAHDCLPGGLAPAMMQQTIGLKTTSGQICQANPWPYPPGAVGAPGAEAPDTPINNEFNLQNE
jgi:Protein of unknown function (DUF3152)